MNERPFQKRVEDMATRFGWKWWHVPAPMRHDRQKGFVPASSAAGLPDLILTHHDPPRLVFMELKGDGGKLSDAQRDFLAAVRDVAEAAFSPSTLAELADNPIVVMGGEAHRMTRPVGVYAFWPKDEPLIEQLLRSKVLT